MYVDDFSGLGTGYCGPSSETPMPDAPRSKPNNDQGSCQTGSVQLPLSSLGGGDGEGQMKHFVQDDKMNVFRLRMCRGRFRELATHLAEPRGGTDACDSNTQPYLGSISLTTNWEARSTRRT